MSDDDEPVSGIEVTAERHRLYSNFGPPYRLVVKLRGETHRVRLEGTHVFECPPGQYELQLAVARERMANLAEWLFRPRRSIVVTVAPGRVTRLLWKRGLLMMGEVEELGPSTSLPTARVRRP